MNLYLEEKTIKARREAAEKIYYLYLHLVLAEKNEKRKEALWKLYGDCYRETYNVENGCYQISDDLDSWLEDNIDSDIQTDWGIEPFCSAVEDRMVPGDGAVVDTDEFRAEALKTVGRWYHKALALKNKESVWTHSSVEKSRHGKKRWVSEKMVHEPNHTNYFIGRLRELLKLVELAHKTKSPIRVAEHYDFGF